ncbi:MAG: GNAT family N-acetyltransferase [Nostoc sp. LLA-1]|nr:GNAT family N-acetyltransferase [Cyanocohniella sp. LLY]
MIKEFTIIDQITIRQAEIKDVERITNLSKQLKYFVSQEQVEQRLAIIQNNDAHVVYVATLDVDNEYVVGWVHAYICDSIVIPAPAIILGLVVDKSYRRHGIGSYLMQQIEQWAFLVGCDSVMLNSNIKRKKKNLFYKKLGYFNIKQSLNFQKKLID